MRQVSAYDIWCELLWEDDYTFNEYRKRGVGSGHSKSGQRKKWRKNYYFEQDLLVKLKGSLDEAAFKARFAGYNPQEIEWFFNKIKTHAIRSKESEAHCRNKLLLWSYKLHNCLSYQQI